MPNNAFGMTALTDLSSQLKTVDRKFANAVRKNLRDGVKEAGAGVLSAVKKNASWSSRIPGATKLSIRYNTKGASVRIITDKKAAPHARALEMGNKTNFSEEAINEHGGFKIVNGRRVAVNRKAYKKIKASGKGLSRGLRHPVYGRGGYAEQATRPFFFPAIEAETPSIDQRMEKVVVKTARDAGFN